MVKIRRSINRNFRANRKAIYAAAIIAFITFLCILPTSNEISQEETKAKATTNKKRLEFVHITKTGGSAIEKAGSEAGIIWGACHFMNITDVGCFNPDIPYIAPNYQSYAKTSPWHTPPKIIKRQFDNSRNPYIGSELFAVVRNPYSRVISEYYCPWLGFQPKFRKNTVHAKDPNDPKIMNYWVKQMVIKLEKSLNDYSNIEPGKRPKQQWKGKNEDPYNLAQKHYVNQAEYVFDGDKQVIKHVVHYEDLSEEFHLLMNQYDLDVKLAPKESGGTYTNNEKKLTYLDLDKESIAIINRYAAKDFDMLGYEMTDSFDSDVNYSLRAKKMDK
jgi:hypothetical protein